MSQDTDDGPLSRNRLDGEASPYLRQHADNPVNWQPWDDAALAAARERDRPIFLSVGYAACHWCHVMAEESFEDPAVAERLNEEFVPVKVDREERPDLDRVYQTVCQAVTGSGGWPLSVWLTPEGDPFYVGTYFPPEPRGNRPAFGEVLDNVADSWADPEDRAAMESRADEWTALARRELESVPDADADTDDPGLDPGGPAGRTDGDRESPLVAMAAALARTADGEHGGFSHGGPKFPSPWRLQALLAAGERTGRERFTEVALRTLDAMADGGLYDHLGGGFHRYATDAAWTVPHFEKMLYDNAELARAYLTAHQVTGEERHATVARETFAFLDRELSHPDGGFHATLDARSRPPDGGEPEEGAFYTWTPESVAAAVDDAELFADRFGVTPGGNFEGETVLTRATSVADLADERDLSPDAVRERLATARRQAFEARAERPRPARDEKVLAGWNGLAVGAFAEGARVLGDDDLAERAETALSFVREHLYDPETGRLARRYAERDGEGDVAGEGYLEDYAFLARGALALYGVTGDPGPLAFAHSLAETVVEAFYDADRGTLYFTPEDGEALVTRPQELRDQGTPSSLAVATEVLAALDGVRPDDRFGEVAARVARTHADRVESRPTEHVSLALATARVEEGVTEVTVAAETDDAGRVAVPEDWHRRLAERYVPDLSLAPRPATEAGLEGWLDRLGLDEPGPVWAGREARDGPTLYVCRDFTCSPPQTGIEGAMEWLDDLAPEWDDTAGSEDGV